MLAKKRQSGATLITSLIMLVVLTLLVVSGIRSSNTNLRIAGNMQMQEEATAAAQQAIEQVLSSNFTAAPVTTTILVDSDNNGTDDYTSVVAVPICTSTKTLTNGELNPLNSADEDCIASGQSTTTGIIGASGVIATAPSWCYKQTWEITSTATEISTGASTILHQGAYIRVPTGTACP